MIICSCNLITDHDIGEAVRSLKEADPYVVLTPGSVFKALRKRPSCGNCLPLFSRAMVAIDEALDSEAKGRQHSGENATRPRGRRAARVAGVQEEGE